MNQSKEHQRARQIVAMLLRRQRKAYNRYKRRRKTCKDDGLTHQLFSEYIIERNAAEFARRILYTGSEDLKWETSESSEQKPNSN